MAWNVSRHGKPRKDEAELSLCCLAPVIMGGEDRKRYFTCSQCHHPCGIRTPASPGRSPDRRV